jgi:hypothetical protein
MDIAVELVETVPVVTIVEPDPIVVEVLNG